MSNPEPLGGPAGPVPGAPGDAPNVLRHYVAVLRRRWRWIVLGLVVGLLGGYASTLLREETRDPTSYYKATHTLIVNQFDPSSQTSSVPNLQQAAFLVQSSQVTDRVAQELDLDPATVTNQVAALPRTDVLAIDVTGISTDPAEAVALADTSAQALNDYLQADSEQQFSATLEETTSRVDELQAELDQLDRDIAAAEPGTTDLMQVTRDSVFNQYRLAVERFQLLAEQGEPVGPLSTLQTASAIQINGGAYNRRLQDNINNRGSLNTGAVATPQQSANDETNIGSTAPVPTSTRVAIGGLTGFVLGLVVAFLLEAWDDRLRRRDRVEKITGLPVIAEVPMLPKSQRATTDVPAVDAPRSRAAERYRAVRTSLLFVLQDHGADVVIGGGAPPAVGVTKVGRRTPVVMVTSPNPGEGKTTTVANVAAVFGDSDIRTLVVDCDYRKPSAGKYLAPVPSPDGEGNPAETRLKNVWFLPAPRNSDSWGQILTQLRRDIDTWRDQFDIVLLDTPPMLATNDASDLLSVADSIVLVLRAGMTRSGPAESVSNLLGRFRADTLGVVLNACSASEMDYGSYGYYGRKTSYYVDETTRRNGSGSGSTGSNGANGHANGAARAANGTRDLSPSAERASDQS